jgi:SAM-dependent methyltransferase
VNAVLTPVGLASWASARERDAQDALSGETPDYTRYHSAQAAKLLDLRDRSVLVVGCNRGSECEYFISIGAKCVTGLDVMEEIGRNFTHPSATYVRASAENMPLESSFDLVFACATLEHVPDIFAAFAEMARVAKPGGFIYNAAAPLWCCRSGPHWGDAFNNEPWPHLRFTVDKVIELGRAQLEQGSDNPVYAEQTLREFLVDPTGMFNRRRAHEYLDACSRLRDVAIIRNDIEVEKQIDFDPEIVETLQEKGYSTLDLFGMTHMFIAKKNELL